MKESFLSIPFNYDPPPINNYLLPKQVFKLGVVSVRNGKGLRLGCTEQYHEKEARRVYERMR